MVLVYTDFFFVLIISIILQSVALLYLWKIHRYIGKEMTALLAGINAVLLLYDIVVTALLLRPPDPNEGVQEVEFWGLFIGFIVPTTNAVLHLVLQRRLAKSLGME